MQVSQAAMDFFMIRGAYGYKEFSNSKDFQEAIENSKEPIDPSKVSSLSPGQTKILNSTSGGNSLIPLLNRMGQLGMMDLREGLVNPEIIDRLQGKSYASTINAYKRSI